MNHVLSIENRSLLSFWCRYIPLYVRQRMRGSAGEGVVVQDAGSPLIEARMRESGVGGVQNAAAADSSENAGIGGSECGDRPRGPGPRGEEGREILVFKVFTLKEQWLYNDVRGAMLGRAEAG